MNRSAATALALAVVLALTAAGGCDKIVGIGALPYPHDATTLEDAGDDADATGDDAGDGGSCVFVPVKPPIPEGGGAACSSGTDASACHPLDETKFSWKWVPPVGAHLGRCTQKQRDDFYTLCIASTATMATCNPWRTNSVNSECQGCLLSVDTDTTFGVIVQSTNDLYLNSLGCLALVEPCNQPCALALQSSFQCQEAACKSCTFNEAITCIPLAAHCSACGEYDQATLCAANLSNDPANHPAVATCALSQTDFRTEYDAVSAFMCGN